MSNRDETPHERLIRSLRMIEPEHHHCPSCNTLLEPHSRGSDFHFCPNCCRDFLVIEGEILSEVA